MMKKHIKNSQAAFGLFLLLAAGLLLPTAVKANTCQLQTWSDFDYRLAFEEMLGAGCFHADVNDSELANSIAQLLNQERTKSGSNLISALNAIQTVLDNSLSANSEQWGNSLALKAAIENLKADIKLSPDNPPAGIMIRWKLGKLDLLPEALDDLDFENSLVSESCDEVRIRQCDVEFAHAIIIVESINLVTAVITRYTSEFRNNVLIDRKVRGASWDSYYQDLAFQYPWEMVVNNWVLDYYDDRAAKDGNLNGFLPLPNSKIIFLHPDVNLIYADNAADEYDLTVTVEAIGFERFKFNKRGKVKDSWGLSLLAAYFPRTDRPESSWTAGLMFRYDGYSIGVTDNHGDTGIVFNIDLSQRLFEVSENSRRDIDEFRSRVSEIAATTE
jgi:hypothetical protein